MCAASTVIRFPVTSATSHRGDSDNSAADETLRTVTAEKAAAAVAILGQLCKRKLTHFSPQCAYLDAVDIVPCSFVSTEAGFMMRMLGSANITQEAGIDTYISSRAAVLSGKFGNKITKFDLMMRQGFESPDALTEGDVVATDAKAAGRTNKMSFKTLANDPYRDHEASNRILATILVAAKAAKTATIKNKDLSIMHAKSASTASLNVEQNKIDKNLAAQWACRTMRMPGLKS